MSEKTQSTAETTKAAVVEHVTEAAHLGQDAITSGGWTYPYVFPLSR
jgi:hypothetical protein